MHYYGVRFVKTWEHEKRRIKNCSRCIFFVAMRGLHSLTKYRKRWPDTLWECKPMLDFNKISMNSIDELFLKVVKWIWSVVFVTFVVPNFHFVFVYICISHPNSYLFWIFLHLKSKFYLVKMQKKSKVKSHSNVQLKIGMIFTSKSFYFRPFFSYTKT